MSYKKESNNNLIIVPHVNYSEKKRKYENVFCNEYTLGA